MAQTSKGVTPARESENALVEAALAVRQQAYAPYSRFLVGAALLAEDGRIYTGCNVENASYGLSLCAERSAVAKAVSEGQQSFTMVAVATETSPPSPPCGQCLQVLAEFSPDLTVILVNPEGERMHLRLSGLLPVRFRKETLIEGGG